MANDQSNLNNLRNTFKIPDAVTIVTLKTGIGPGGTPIKQKQPSFPELSNFDYRDSPLPYRSVLNTPVYTNIEFLPGKYETSTKGVFKEFGSAAEGSPDRLRYDAVLITVSQAKKIIKTEIQGRDGTVKEYIGMDDYQVSVNGIICGRNGVRPMQEVAGLKKMLDAPIAIEVASAYLQNLGIHFLVVDSYELGEQEGSYSYQPFSINFISDVQQELILINT